MRIPTITDGAILLDGSRLADVAAMVAGEDEEHARRFGWWPARSTEQTAQAAIERWQHEWRTRRLDKSVRGSRGSDRRVCRGL